MACIRVTLLAFSIPPPPAGVQVCAVVQFRHAVGACSDPRCTILSENVDWQIARAGAACVLDEVDTDTPLI